MSTKQVTHTAKMRGQFNADELSVQFFTRMTRESLTDFKLETGRQWLLKHCQQNGFTPEQAADMWLDPLLLQWWNLEWRRIDHHIILPMIYKVVEGEREAVYKSLHRGVLNEQHPNYEMLELALMRTLKNTSSKQATV